MAIKNFKDSINKTRISDKPGINKLFAGSQENKDLDKENISDYVHQKEPEEVRQTFIVKTAHLEKIKDYVHLKRQQGDSLFTQKEALQEALELFFKKVGDIPIRPEQIKEAEKKRSDKIRRK